MNKSYSEKEFQNKLVDELSKYRWTSPDELNGNIQRVTVDDLIIHWRKELNRINADQLEGVPLTDNEFQQVMSKVNSIANSFEAAKILSMESSVGKIDGIYRCDDSRITRKQITLTIFNKAEVGGGDSSYRIAREVTSEKGNRFDLVLLINGLPLINIELKRADIPLEGAFGQIKRYYRDGEYTHNFMAFSQMMVIISEIETRYFATPKSVDDFNMSFVFHWADKNNVPVHEYSEVVKQFLMIPMAHNMVGDYSVIDESKDEDKRRHMILRPYQVYAILALSGAAYGYDNEDKIPHGGYIWHTTGSGKTITSFKSALFLSSRGGFDKVIFLVDRKELDQKTSENFKAYASYESVIVDDTKSTYRLGKLLDDSTRGIVVTTTFKLNSLVKELEENKDYRHRDKRITFIIDEAHRTTMGDMMVNIKEYFNKNALFFGFTGTPLFEENKVTGMFNKESEHINTTEKLFGPELHRYTIDEAIQDKNVLGFNIDFINTGEFKSYDDLKEKLIEKEKLNSDESDRTIERRIQSLSNLEVEKLAKEKKLLFYLDKNHIPNVVSEILDNYEEQSQGRFFNAILTVGLKQRVIDYYNEFKKQMDERDYHINIAMTFSNPDENDPDNTDREAMGEMFKDYAKYTKVQFTMDDSGKGINNYYEDLVDRSTNGGSGRNPKNIDLMIVAEQLLTGYDNKYLNTLYIDKPLKLQNLVQAYSRTNRLFGPTKEFGTVINFKFPKITREQADKALKLYGSGGTNSRAIVDQYPVTVNKFANLVTEMKEYLNPPTDWALIKGTEIAKEFKSSFSKANTQFNLVSQYYKYEWNDEDFGLTFDEWLKYTGAYKNLMDEVDPPIVPTHQIIHETKLVGTQIVDAQYIIDLMGEKSKTVDGVKHIDDESLRLIYEKIQELSDLGNHMDSLLLKEFVNTELTKGKIKSDESFDTMYLKWKENIKGKEILEYAEKMGIDYELLKKSFEVYSLSKPEYTPYIEDITRTSDYEKVSHDVYENKLEYSIALAGDISEWMKKTKKKF